MKNSFSDAMNASLDVLEGIGLTDSLFNNLSTMNIPLYNKLQNALTNILKSVKTDADKNFYLDTRFTNFAIEYCKKAAPIYLEVGYGEYIFTIAFPDSQAVFRNIFPVAFYPLFKNTNQFDSPKSWRDEEEGRKQSSPKSKDKCLLM